MYVLGRTQALPPLEHSCVTSANVGYSVLSAPYPLLSCTCLGAKLPALVVKKAQETIPAILYRELHGGQSLSLFVPERKSDKDQYVPSPKTGPPNMTGVQPQTCGDGEMVNSQWRNRCR